MSPLQVIEENDHLLFSVKSLLRLKAFIYLGQSSEGLVLSLLVSLLCRPYDLLVFFSKYGYPKLMRLKSEVLPAHSKAILDLFILGTQNMVVERAVWPGSQVHLQPMNYLSSSSSLSLIRVIKIMVSVELIGGLSKETDSKCQVCFTLSTC